MHECGPVVLTKYDAMQIDCHRLGVTECWQVARAAAFYGTKIVPHNWSTSLGTVANAHLVAGAANAVAAVVFALGGEAPVAADLLVVARAVAGRARGWWKTSN